MTSGGSGGAAGDDRRSDRPDPGRRPRGGRRSRGSRFDGRPDDADQVERRLGTRDDPTPLGDALDRYVRNLGAPPVSILSQLQDRWPDVVGPGLSGPTRPAELVDRVLTIACEDAAWAAQVGWMEAQIAQRFEAVFGPDLLDRIVTRVDR